MTWLTWLFIGNRRFYYFIIVFDFEIQIISNFLYPEYFFPFQEQWLTLLSQEFQNYRSHPKRIFFFSFNDFSNPKTLFPRCNIPGLKMTCQWDWQVILLPTGRSSKYKSPLEGSIFKSEVGFCHHTDLPSAG